MSPQTTSTAPAIVSYAEKEKVDLITIPSNMNNTFDHLR